MSESSGHCASRDVWLCLGEGKNVACFLSLGGSPSALTTLEFIVSQDTLFAVLETFALSTPETPLLCRCTHKLPLSSPQTRKSAELKFVTQVWCLPLTGCDLGQVA